MRIHSDKIPTSYTYLPDLVPVLNMRGHEALHEIFARLYRMDGKPDSSNATYKQIANELMNLSGACVFFKFYYSKNILFGGDVISHASNKNRVNYNKRFRGVKTFSHEDWFANFFHELTHLADQNSPFTFGHKDQKDENSAPEVVGRIAREVFKSRKWL